MKLNPKPALHPLTSLGNPNPEEPKPRTPKIPKDYSVIPGPIDTERPEL